MRFFGFVKVCRWFGEFGEFVLWNLIHSVDDLVMEHFLLGLGWLASLVELRDLRPRNDLDGTWPYMAHFMR